jgi:formate C-acetyltransferase
VNAFTEFLDEQTPHHRKGKYQAGFYTSYFHGTMGKMTGALPDGRCAGEALSSSLSPMAGTDQSGPIAVIQSTGKIDMTKFGNGMVLDMKFLPSFFEKESHRKGVQTLVEEYFAEGGMEIQFNVVDTDTLIAAQKEPWKYQDLIVRVSGYSAYFVELDTNLQNEIIQRTVQTA